MMIDFAKFTNLDFGQILGKVPASKARPSNILPAWADQRPSFFKIKDPARLEGRERALQAQLMPLTLLPMVAAAVAPSHMLGAVPAGGWAAPCGTAIAQAQALRDARRLGHILPWPARRSPAGLRRSRFWT